MVGTRGIDESSEVVGSDAPAETRNGRGPLVVGVPTEIVVAEGGIAHELERVVAETGATVLILGRSHGGLLHHLL